VRSVHAVVTTMIAWWRQTYGDEGLVARGTRLRSLGAHQPHYFCKDDRTNCEFITVAN